MAASVKRIFQIALPVTALCLLGGCLAPGHALTPGERAVAAAARPILTLDPDAVWTDCFNRLVELGPESIAYLMQQPAMTRPAAPDDLSTLLHASLIRLLAGSAGVPRLSATSFETTLNVLHFDLKVGGRRIGTIVMPRPQPPRAWHELYPADFNHALAAQVDVEADRQALREWWLARRGQAATQVAARRLTPQSRHLWHVLTRRYADRWQYQPEPRAVLCAAAAGSPALLDIPTYDYNLVRAVEHLARLRLRPCRRGTTDRLGRQPVAGGGP